MKKERVYDFAYGVNMRDIEENLVIVDFPEEEVLKIDSKASFIKIVYALDPVTNCPTGDLSYLISDKANPEVKQWILDNIMIDVSAAAMPASPRGLSDDDIASLVRDPKESTSSYLERVNNYVRLNRDIYERMAIASSKSVENEVNVPSDE